MNLKFWRHVARVYVNNACWLLIILICSIRGLAKDVYSATLQNQSLINIWRNESVLWITYFLIQASRRAGEGTSLGRSQKLPLCLVNSHNISTRVAFSHFTGSVVKAKDSKMTSPFPYTMNTHTPSLLAGRRVPFSPLTPPFPAPVHLSIGSVRPAQRRLAHACGIEH